MKVVGVGDEQTDLDGNGSIRMGRSRGVDVPGVGKMKFPINLEYGERVIAVVPERCSGPSWYNEVFWVHITTMDGRLRTECIQPKEMTTEMHHLFGPGASMCRALMDTVTAVVV